MKCYYNIIAEQRNNYYKSLIFEDIYTSDIFEKLINYISHKIRYNSDIVKINYDTLIDLLPKNWMGIKYLNRKKSLYVLSVSVFTNQCNLNLTKAEIIYIDNTLNKDKGVFCSDFDNEKKIGLMILKDDLYEAEFKNICMHELIHFIQWSTGKTMHNILRNKQFNISSSDLNQIKNILKIDANNLIRNISDPAELEAYCNTIFYDFKSFCFKHKLKFNRDLILFICSIFKNKNFNSFQDYYHDISAKLNSMDLNLILTLDSFAVLLLLGYFKIGFNAFKNHIYSYFENDKGVKE